MTSYTLEQLNEMTNEQLDEVVALAQGAWFINGAWWCIPACPSHILTKDYHPSTNKEQAWDLSFGNQFSPKFRLNGLWSILDNDGDLLVDDMTDPLIAVTIASILHLQGSE